MEFCIGAIPRYQGQGLLTDKFRPDFAGKRAKEDLVMELFKKCLDLFPEGMNTIGTIGKCVGRDKTGMFIPVGIPGYCIDRTVSQAMPEDLGSLAIPAGKRTASRDLHVSLFFRKCRESIEQDC